MPQVQKDEVRQRILAAATDEFCAKDYRSATMRDIAAKAGVPTGLSYTYFGNKAELFAAVIQPVLEAIGCIFDESGRDSRPSFDGFLIKESDLLLELIRCHRKQLIVLTDKSRGTAYERTKEELVRATEAHAKKHFLEMSKGTGGQPDDLFFHILASGFVEGFLEIARHYRDDRWAGRMVRDLTRHYVYGIHGLVEA